MEPSAITATLIRIVMPGHANSQGTVFGGVLLSMIDESAAVVARRHSRRDVVTAHMDQVDFEEPVRVGQLAEVTARLVATGRTSMKIAVEAYGEDFRTGRRWRCTRATVVMVALDDDHRPTPVPPVPADAPRGA